MCTSHCTTFEIQFPNSNLFIAQVNRTSLQNFRDPESSPHNTHSLKLCAPHIAFPSRICGCLSLSCQNCTLGHAMRKIIAHSTVRLWVPLLISFAKTARLAMPCARLSLTLLLPSIVSMCRNVSHLLFQRHLLLAAPTLPPTSQAM